MSILDKFLGLNCPGDVNKQSIDSVINFNTELDNCTNLHRFNLTIRLGGYSIKHFEVENISFSEENESLVVKDVNNIVSYIPLENIEELELTKKFRIK